MLGVTHLYAIGNSNVYEVKMNLTNPCTRYGPDQKS